MIKPMFDKVLVEKLEENTQKRGILYVPDNASSAYAKGKVVAVGTGRIDSGVIVPLTIKEGDSVIFFRPQAVEVSDDGKEFLIISERDIVAKF